MAVTALRDLRERQLADRMAAGELWQECGLVFTPQIGTPLDAGNVRRMFKNVCTAAGLGDNWTPRELRTSFVSLMSHRGVSIEEIARLVGHSSTRVTETVYRRELRPVITIGAEVMDQIFTDQALGSELTSRCRDRGCVHSLVRRNAARISPALRVGSRA